jgi:uncharacterized protein (TIRG00374 family)
VSKLLLRLLVSLVIAGILVWWLMSQGFDVIPSLEEIRGAVSWWAIPAYVGLFALFHTLRAWRWVHLLRPFARVPTATMLETAFTGFMAIQMMPLRTGEVARPYLLDRYTGTSKSALFGTIAIERVIDGLMVSLWLTVALFTIPAAAGPYVWGLRLLPLSIFAFALVLLVAFHRRPALVSRLLERVLGLVSKRLASFATGVIERFHAGLAALPDRRSFWSFVGASVLYWGINAVSFYVLARGCGLALPAAGAVAGMGVLAVGILLPAGPGYFGNFQIAVLAALEMYLPQAAASGPVAVFIFLLYVLQTGLTVAFGAVGALLLRRRPVIRRAGERAGAVE